MAYWRLPRCLRCSPTPTTRAEIKHETFVLNDFSLFYHVHICHDEFIFGLAQWQSLRALLPDILRLWFWTQPWLQSGFHGETGLLVWWIQSMPCMYSLCAKSAQSSILYIVWGWISLKIRTQLRSFILQKRVGWAYFVIDYVFYSLLPAAPFLFTEVLFSTGLIILCVQPLLLLSGLHKLLLWKMADTFVSLDIYCETVNQGVNLSSVAKEKMDIISHIYIMFSLVCNKQHVTAPVWSLFLKQMLAAGGLKMLL